MENIKDLGDVDRDFENIDPVTRLLWQELQKHIITDSHVDRDNTNVVWR